MDFKPLIEKLAKMVAEGEIEEGNLTRNALYSQMRKTSNPASYEPEVNTDDEFDMDDDTHYQPEEESAGVSCWGCGQDWKHNWSAEDLGTGEGLEQHGLDSDDRICPDCVEELGGYDELDEAEDPHTCSDCGRPMPNWEPGDESVCDECELGMSPEDSNPDFDELDEAEMCEDCGASPCMCEDPLAEADFDKIKAAEDSICKKCKKGKYKIMTLPDDQEGRLTCTKCRHQVRRAQQGDDEYNEELTEKKLTAAEKRKREELAKGMKGADWEERYPGRGEEVMYATATKRAKELAEANDDSSEFSPTSECVKACYVNERHSPMCPHYVELSEAKECNCAGPCDCKKNSLEEMRQLAGLTECGEMYEPMPAAQPTELQKSKMTVTTSMDSEAGTKQVTVSAEGEGADELIRVLQMAGVSVAPGSSNTIVDEVANEPAPQTLDSKSMLLDLSGGPNAPHGQYNPDRARDNSMSMMGEAVDRLAARLQARFNSQK
jgi:hypothetical protein